MNILFIDDDWGRQLAVKAALPEGCQVLMAINAKMALNFGAAQWDLVCFDHDLGLGMNGSELVTRWFEQGLPMPGRAVVHSNNLMGAANIASKLRGMDTDVVVDAFGDGFLKRFPRDYCDPSFWL